jgi:hypothetical protein
MAEAYDYDIILLDLTRPDIEGYEVQRRLRAARVRTPILPSSHFSWRSLWYQLFGRNYQAGVPTTPHLTGMNGKTANGYIPARQFEQQTALAPRVVFTIIALVILGLWWAIYLVI